jgi:hypothetical protein
MGANFVTLDFPATHTKAQVKEGFNQARERSLHMDGHSYSGEIGMATGLIFHDDLAPFTEEAAYHWLTEKAEKWEEARCVRLIDGSWLIGASCSS